MPEEERPDIGWSAGARSAFSRLCLTGADAYLGQRFETPALLAALLWDAGAGGFSVSEPGSALALVWRAAQEMEGRQAATAVARPGTLVTALTRAQAMAQFRPRARVTQNSDTGGRRDRRGAGRWFTDRGRSCDLHLAARTHAQAGGPAGNRSPDRRSAEFCCACGRDLPCRRYRRRVIFLCRGRMRMPTPMKRRARAGSPPNLPMEWVMLSPDQIAVTARPVPAPLRADGRARVAAQAVMALSRAMPGVAGALDRCGDSHPARTRRSGRSSGAPAFAHPDPHQGALVGGRKRRTAAGDFRPRRARGGEAGSFALIRRR